MSTNTLPLESQSGKQAALYPEKIMQLALAFWGSKALLSAVELGVFTELAKEPLDAATLTKRLGLHERASQDFFDCLVALGILERHGDAYKNSKEADLFLDTSKTSYIGGFLEMSNSRLYPAWGRLTEGLRSGKPQNEANKGADFFGQLYADPHRLKLFLSAMTGISLGLAKEIADKFDWAKYKTFCDVGTAQGALAVEVAKRHNHLSGYGFDLPQVEPIFIEYITRHGLQERLQFQKGDFFKDDLPCVDVLVMGHILHDWDLDQKRMLVRKAHKALNNGGALIVYDAMIDNDRRHNTFGLLMSLNMLIETPGGFDYTTEQCTGWLQEAGFKDVRCVQISPTHSMGIGIK